MTGSSRGPFTIRVVPAESTDPGLLAELLEKAYVREPALKGCTRVSGDRGDRKLPSVLLELSSLSAILRGLGGKEIAARLTALVEPAVEAL